MDFDSVGSLVQASIVSPSPFESGTKGLGSAVMEPVGAVVVCNVMESSVKSDVSGW